MRSLSDLYKRWRHTRGFGVHSPSAYRLVRDVVAPSGVYAWYGYAAVDEALEGASRLFGRRRKEGRLALRMAWWLRPELVWCAGPLDRAVIAGLRSVVGEERVVSGDLPSADAERPILAVINGDGTEKATLVSDALSRGFAVLVLNCPGEEMAGMTDMVCREMGSGVVLSGRRRLIAVPRKDMALSRYTVL